MLRYIDGRHVRRSLAGILREVARGGIAGALSGSTVPSAPLRVVGRIAVLAAVVLGGLHIAAEVARIYAVV